MSRPRPLRVHLAPKLALSPLTVVLVGWMAVKALLALFIFV
jgi:hypothetical protein